MFILYSIQVSGISHGNKKDFSNNKKVVAKLRVKTSYLSP